MSLVHKYRPKNLEGVVGQASVVKALKGAIKQSRLHSAYLFAGSRGTGKTSIARVLAKSLNCEKGQSITPCGECHSCRAIESGNSIDVFEIDAASNNGVEYARELVKGTSLSSIGGKYKVYIIDECHNLTKQASEALLKTVEEPGAKTIFVFCTTEPSKVLKTIESRCQVFKFKPVDEELIFTHLSHIVHFESLIVSPDIITAISQLTDGVVRDAVTILDQISLNYEATIDDLYDLIGKIPSDYVINLINSVASKKSITIYSALKECFKSGLDPLQLLSEISNFTRNALVAKQDSSAYKLMTCDSASFKKAGIWAKSFDIQTLECIVIFLRNKEIDFSAAKIPKLFLESCLIEMMHLLDSPTKQAIRDVKNDVSGTQPYKPNQLEKPISPKLTKSTQFEANWNIIKSHEGMAKLAPLITNWEYFSGINELVITLPDKYRSGREKAIFRIQQACEACGIILASVDVKFE
jgi:DNA polymerase-3 subunit gamma/tau